MIHGHRIAGVIGNTLMCASCIGQFQDIHLIVAEDTVHSQNSRRSVTGQSQVNHRTVAGQSQISHRSVTGQSQSDRQQLHARMENHSKDRGGQRVS